MSWIMLLFLWFFQWTSARGVSGEALPNFIIFRFNDVVGIVNILMRIMLLREKLCHFF
jgi:hypothetical protein